MIKKLSLLVLICTIGFFLAVTPSEVLANVFASDVKVVNPGGAEFDGDLNDNTPGVGIQFRLNENATSVVIEVSDGSGVVATVDAGPQAQGLNVVVWAGVDDSGSPVPAGDYTFSVTANDAVGHSSYDVVYAQSGTVIFTRGGTTIRNPAAPNFGHPIGGNGGGGGLKRGPLNFWADGTGSAQTPENLDRFSPFDVRDLGGAGRLYMLTSDDDGNLYYSDRLDPLSKIYTFAASLDTSTFAVVTTSDDSSKAGVGIDVVGTGADRTIYWGLGNTVVRGAIGEAATFDPANFEVVAEFAPDGDTANVFVRDLVIDDSGFLYVSLRTGGQPTGNAPGLAVERYDISGALPVARTDRNWTIPVGFDNGDGRPVGFGLNRGTDLTSNADDRVYFSGASGTADGNWNTMSRIDDLAAGGSTPVFEDISGSGTTSSNADMSIDAAGNLIWFENSSEWLIAVSPADGPNSFTTPANDAISITGASTANAHPSVIFVDDVPNDQGNQVLVAWSGSINDRHGSSGVDGYEVYRQIHDGGSAAEGSELNGPPGKWELVGSTSARNSSNYALTVPTVVNATPDGAGTSYFYVSAVGSSRWDSNRAGGASVDNLIPAAPQSLAASEGETANLESVVLLTWLESDEADFNYFEVVRGTEAGFDAASGEVVGTTTETSLTDASIADGGTYFYRVVAYDFNGNQGDFSEEVSLVVTSVGGSGSSIPDNFSLQQNYPNPFNPTTSIAYDLAKDSDVTLQIFNMRGQEIRTLVSGTKPAGSHTIQWNGRDDSGLKVASGIYVYMIKAGAFVKSRRLTLLK